VIDREKMERYCSTDQSPQQAVAPTEEEEEVVVSRRKCRSPNAILAQLKNCHLAVSNTIELKNIRTTLDSTGTFLSRNTHWYMSLLSHVFVIFLS